MANLTHLADRVVGRPLLLHPDKIQVILWALQGRIGVALDETQLVPEASRFRGRRSNHGPYAVENGAAILPIVGSLVNRGAWVGAYSGLVSYEGIEAQLDAALADDAVNRIVLDIDSPGGEATGMFRLAEKLRAVRQRKPITAFVNDMAASAAYGIAASASRIIVSPSSIVGSIGVVMVHLDRSAEFEAKGQRPTLIFAGAHKVDGHPFAALPETVRAELQAEVEKFYALFVASVSAGRPQLSKTRSAPPKPAHFSARWPSGLASPTPLARWKTPSPGQPRRAANTQRRELP
jgi:signal peptide peptidase SppA